MNDQQICQGCPSFCLLCSPLGCSACMVGFTLTSSFTCAQACLAPCATCNNNNNTQCTSCLAGYILSGSSCAPVTTCNGTCNYCPFNYMLMNQSCLQCSNNTCARCLASNLSSCASCFSGYYLNQGSCMSCPTGCSTCINQNNCLTCALGFVSQVQSIATQTLCVACQAPCAQCVRNAQTCTVCQQGYTLNGWGCVSTFNFGFTVTLSTNLTTFYSNYATFLSQIISAVGSSNFNTVAINLISGISSNSAVIVNGNVSTTTSTESN